MARSSSFRRAALLCSALLLGLAGAKEIKVKATQKIQDAIDAADPGDKITVAKGNYPEQLTITKNGLQIVGQNGATLTPPMDPVTNGCTDLVGAGLQAGICIGGSVVYAPGPLPVPEESGEHRKVQSVTTYVNNVLVKGLTVKDFNGLNIAIVGANNTEVRENTVVDSNRYGILTVGSLHTKIARNTVVSEDLRFIGICMDDTSDVSVTVNTVSTFFIGLCVQTNGADVSHNTVSDCCIGAFVDPGVDGAHITHNKISNTPAICNFGFFSFVSGIRIIGATNTDVQHNDISGITDFGYHDDGPGGNIAAAIAVYDDFPPGGGGTGDLAKDNKIDFNDLFGNDLDIHLLTSSNNEIKHNMCTTPSSICSKQ